MLTILTKAYCVHNTDEVSADYSIEYETAFCYKRSLVILKENFIKNFIYIRLRWQLNVFLGLLSHKNFCNTGDFSTA